jgi:hypothetical protein
MNQTTIDRIKAMIAQNNQMNHDLTEVLTLAEQGWKVDTSLIESEIQKGKDAVAQQVVDLTTRAETAEATLITKEVEITDLKEQVKNLTPKETVPTDTEPVTP